MWFIGCRVWGFSLGFVVQDFELRTSGLGAALKGSEFGFKVYGLGLSCGSCDSGLSFCRNT